MDPLPARFPVCQLCTYGEACASDQTGWPGTGYGPDAGVRLDTAGAQTRKSCDGKSSTNNSTDKRRKGGRRKLASGTVTIGTMARW
jgi:hypothetical protein